MPFLEFPKWITAPSCERLIVQDADEEAAIMGTMCAVIAAPVQDEKADLTREAERRGIPIDKRWGIERIRYALDPAGDTPCPSLT